MALTGNGAKRRWMASVAAAALLVGVAMLLFRSPRIPTSDQGVRTQGLPIKLKSGATDELALRDLAPLFLPTRFNAAPDKPREQKPGSVLLDVSVGHLQFTELNPRLDVPAPLQAPGTPVDALKDPPGPLAAGIGQTDATIRPLQPHAAFVEIFAADSGQPVLGQVLTLDANPPSSGDAKTDWRPLEFMASVDASGLVASLVLTSSSGTRAVDDHFRSYLAQSFHIDDRLTPGFYRIVVGP